MPRATDGSYSLPPGTIASPGDTLLVSQHNPAFNDVAQALSNSLSRDGQGSMRADLDMGGFSLTNVDQISTTGDVAIGGDAEAAKFTAPRFEVIEELYFGTISGNPNAPLLNFDSGDGIVYIRSENKFYFRVASTNIASIDASGNLRIAGAITQGVTP